MLKAQWRVCNGEAHSNPHIDHCGVCMPFWGDYPVCPYCGRKMPARAGNRLKCTKCHRFVDMTEPRVFKIDEAYTAREERMKKFAELRKEKEMLKPDTRPIVESKLSHGDKVELHAAIRDLQMACARIGAALEANNKFTEFETLKEAYMAVKRVDPTLANIMFNFVRGTK